MKSYTEYNGIKNQILNLLKNLEDVATLIHQDEKLIQTQIQINKTKEHLHNKNFYVALVGEMCRGKSTVMNGLMDPNRDFCKTNLDVNTARTTLFKYSEKEKVVITTMENQRKLIGINELYEYTDKEGNYVDNTKYISVSLKNLLLKNGINLVDTPGVNDPDEERENVTVDFLQKADAVLFILDAENQIGASELRFLRKKIVNDSGIKSILFALNKIDFFDEEELEIIYQDLLKKTNKTLLELTGEQIDKLIKISAKNYVEGVKQADEELIITSNFNELRSELEEFLISVKGRAKLNKVIALIENKYLRSVNNSIDEYKSIYTLSLDEKKKKLNDLEREKTKLKSTVDQIKWKLKQTEHKIIADFNSKMNFNFSEIDDEIEEIADSVPDKKTKKELKKRVYIFLGRQQIELQKFIENLIQTKTAPLFSNYGKHLEEFYSNLNICFQSPVYYFDDFEYATKRVKKQRGFLREIFSVIRSFFEPVEDFLEIFDKTIIKKNIYKEKEKLRNLLIDYAKNVIDEIEIELSSGISKNIKSTENNLINALKESDAETRRVAREKEKMNKSKETLFKIKNEINSIRHSING